MALDGIAVACIAQELKQSIMNARIDKIYQPENDEIILNLRCFKNNYKLLLTANPSHPRLHFTTQAKQNPITAPLFCMVLRKHLMGGRIIDITQPNFERIIFIHVESINELGDLSVKKIIIEIMGKHSNIILIDENDMVLDSVKRISHEKSSVREILPGKTYIFPPSHGKLDPTATDKDEFLRLIPEKAGKIHQAIYKTYNGISPVMACEICFRAGIDCDLACSALETEQTNALAEQFNSVMGLVKEGIFNCEAYYDDSGKLFEFSVIPFTQFKKNKKTDFDSISETLTSFYAERDNTYRTLQKTQDLRKIVSQNIERCVKKKEMQLNSLIEIENRDEHKIFGELVTANIYSIEKGMTMVNLTNYYDGTEVIIALDATLTPSENAQRYFKRYNKEKRAFQAINEQMVQNSTELIYLETVLNSLLSAEDENDIDEIREELAESGYVKKRKSVKQKQKKSKPLSFKSSDGFDIYVGKNNKQNDELTLKFARNDDIWLHTKEIPGSHVIVRANGKPVPNSTLDEAVNLAAYYSKARNSALVPVDYTLIRNVKKPNGAKPGMVIYEVYKTAYITPDEERVNSMVK